MRVEFYFFTVDAPVGYSAGAALLSQELRERGHEVRLCHVDERVGLPWEPRALAARTAAFAPDLIAVSFGSPHARHAHSLLAALHAALPATRVVVGGLHPTLNPEEVMAWPGVRALGRGEADGTLADFVDAWAQGEAAPEVPGFWVRGADGGLRRNRMRLPPPLPGMGALDETLDFAAITRAGRGMVSLSVTRGCPYRCSYCHNEAVVRAYAEDLGLPAAQIPYVRRRSVDDAVAEVRRMVARAGDAAQAISFDDDTMFEDRSWFEAFVRRLKAEVGLPYVFMGNLARLDEALADLLAETDCLLMKFGLETASPRLRREVMNRRQPLREVEKAVALLRARGVNTRAYVILGIPTESRAELWETLALCGRSQIDTVRVAYLQPYPGTRLHRLCEEQGLLVPGAEKSSYADGSPLRWPPDHDLLLRKMIHIHAWVMTAHLPDSPAAPRYQALVDEALALDEAAWAAALAEGWPRRRSLALHAELRPAGVPHYLCPFPDRPDSAFLMGVRRRLPFPNVDDAWPPDMVL